MRIMEDLKYSETMIKRKTKVKENEENGVQGVKRISTVGIDHWAFLEEIDAPMWADLTLEARLMTDDNDDEWFHTSHLFHNNSARQLRCAFAHSDVGNDFNFNLQAISSPKLPSSVSKSRGKDYRNRNWVSNGHLSLNKCHPVNGLGGKISVLDEGSSQESKTEVSCGNQSGGSSSITSVTCNNSCAARDALNSQSVRTSGVSTSTIATGSGQQQNFKVLEVSKEAFGQTGGLLDALKTNLRKSCATRPALRVEICDVRESKERKSSSGKSSVGSSSSIGYVRKSKSPGLVQNTDHQRRTRVEMNANREAKGHKSLYGKSNMSSSNPRLEVKRMAPGLKQNEDRNLNDRDLGKLAVGVKERKKAKNMAKASVSTKNAHKSRIVGRDVATFPSQKDANSKVPLKTIPTNSSSRIRPVPQGVKDKAESRGFNGVVCSGKENISGRVALSQRSDAKVKIPVVRVSDQKIPKLNKLENKVGKSTTLGSKLMRTGKGNDGKLSSNSRVTYFR